ncbi:hypothetical protein MPSEU_001049000 [Mayamaea pseudoterrestris]|nr:hypothetical protein MPSEU_001049000 [Mayamaea pseudoterrestris]
MEQHPFPIASTASRETFRRSLQSSLNDVLGYLGGLEPYVSAASRPFDFPPLPAPRGLPMLHDSTALSTSPPSSLLMQTLGMNQGSMARQLSPLYASQLESQMKQEALKKHAEKQIKNAQISAFLQQMALEKRQETLRDALLFRLLQSRRAENQPLQQQHQPFESAGVIAQGSTFHEQDSIPSVVTIPAANDRFIGEQQVKVQQRKQNAFTLHALGNNLRSRNDPFIDCLDIADPNEDHQAKPSKQRRARGGVASHFPERLHQMLLDVQDNDQTDIVSFLSHGRAFSVHDMDRFVSEVLPKYFKQSKWNSFARQLSLYGFIRIANGPDAGGYWHELFLQSRPSLCLHMRRVGVPTAQQDRRKCRPKNVSDLEEPDFYAMKKSMRMKDSE